MKIKRVGAKITMTWVSPKDRDLSKFRVTLFNNGPAKRPAIGKAIVTGRVLHASFNAQGGAGRLRQPLRDRPQRQLLTRHTADRHARQAHRAEEQAQGRKKVAKKKASGTKTPPKKKN